MHEQQPSHRAKSRSLRVIEGGAGASRPVPSSVEAEAQLISCCLIDGGPTLALCRQKKLSGRGFYSAANRTVYETMVDMQMRSLPIELSVLLEELKAKHQLEDVGGVAYLMEVTKTAPTSASASYLLDRLLTLSVLRELIREGADLVESCYAFEGDLVGFVSARALKLQRWADLIAGLNREGLDVRMQRRLDYMLEAAAGKVDKERWLHWGLPWLDACLGCLDVRAEDWYVIVGGPPSGGKSSFMRGVAIHNVFAGKRVAVFLLETGLLWLEAAAATLARVNLRVLRNSEATRDMVERYTEAFGQLQALADKNLFVYEDLMNVEDIEREVRQLNRSLFEHDIASGVPADKARGLDMIVVDYLQLMGTRENFRGMREQAVAHMSRTIKKLLKSLNIVGLVGAQINRGSREDPAKPPTLTALRESGAIEQDADRVVFVFTPPVNRAGQPQDGNAITDEVEIIQRKCRNGPRDVSVGVLFHKTQTRYEEAARAGGVRPGLPKPDGGYKRTGSGA